MNLSSQVHLVEEAGRLVGVLTTEMARRAADQGRSAAPLRDLATSAFVVIDENTTLFEIVTRMRRDRVAGFIVAPSVEPLPASDVRGWISKERIADTMVEAMGLFED